MNRYHQLGRSDIDKLRRLIIRKLPKGIFLASRTWRHIKKLETLRAMNMPMPYKFPKEEKRILLNHSKEILQAVCDISGGTWTNEHYCPEGFLGGYIWTFQVQIIQEVIWQREEFLDGFHYQGRKFRDGNPYEDQSRSTAWDAGYILQLECSKKKDGALVFDQWMKFLKALKPSQPTP